MSINDVLDALDASRGGFYHYFGSKVVLLEAVVGRMVVAGTEAVAPIVADPDLPALTKLDLLFSGIAQWKAERRELVLALMQVCLSDDNAIIRQGTAEGLFRVSRTAPLGCWSRSSRARRTGR